MKKTWALLGTLLACAVVILFLERRNSELRERVRRGRAAQRAAQEALGAANRRFGRLAAAEARLAVPTAAAGPAGAATPAPPTLYSATNYGKQGLTVLRARMRVFVAENYAALFRRWQLPPDQQQEVENLLIEKAATFVALANGISSGRVPGIESGDSTALQAAAAAATRDLDENLQKTLGEGLYSQYRDYASTLRYRAETNDFAAQFKNSAAPIRDDQSDRIIALLAASDHDPFGPLPESFAGDAAAIFDPAQTTAASKLVAEAQARRTILARNQATIKAGTLPAAKSDGRDLLLKN